MASVFPCFEVKVKKLEVPYIDNSRPELALHCWQLVGKNNVYGTAPTAAQHILIASPTSAQKDGWMVWWTSLSRSWTENFSHGHARLNMHARCGGLGFNQLS